MPAELRLKTYRELVEQRLDALLPPAGSPPAELHEAMRYSVMAPGKRLRPALCLSSAEAIGGDPALVLDAACSLELVHCFSLIHDDLPAIDNDALRRGMPTVHIKFGEAMAVLAGDALFALAFDVLSHVFAPPEALLRAVRVLAKASGSDGLVGGEVVDVLSEGRQVSTAELEYIHSRKTGALIAAACEIGGLLAGADIDRAAQLRRFGEHVGLAFQIADDLLNELSTPEMIGKAAGSDRARQKATYPALFGLDGSRAAAREHVRLASECIGDLPNREGLMELAHYAVDRLH